VTSDFESGAPYQRTFVLAVPKDKAWECFTDPGERSAWLAEPDAGNQDHYTTAGGSPGFSVTIDEVVAFERLRWTERHVDPSDKIEICVVFEDADTGTRITVTQARFGEIDDANWQASHRGWDEAIADLAFYLRTGLRVRRHFSHRGATGMMCHETLAGVEVAKVFPDGFGADAGLEPGDLLLDVAGAAIFTMAELWAIVREHRPGDRLAIRYVRGRHLCSSQAALSNSDDFPQ
jgi:uncharacterized protein YndB with AHSA1/START domain